MNSACAKLAAAPPTLTARTGAGAPSALDARSNKMRHLAGGSSAAIAGDWFTAHGKGVNMGAFGSAENRALAEKLENVFSAWIHNGDSDLASPDTVILKIELADDVLLSHGTRYEF